MVEPVSAATILLVRDAAADLEVFMVLSRVERRDGRAVVCIPPGAGYEPSETSAGELMGTHPARS